MVTTVQRNEKKAHKPKEDNRFNNQQTLAFTITDSYRKKAKCPMTGSGHHWICGALIQAYFPTIDIYEGDSGEQHICKNCGKSKIVSWYDQPAEQTTDKKESSSRDSDELLSTVSLAQELRCSLPNIHLLIKQFDLKVVKIKRCVFIPKSEWNKVLDYRRGRGKAI